MVVLFLDGRCKADVNSNPIPSKRFSIAIERIFSPAVLVLRLDGTLSALLLIVAARNGLDSARTFHHGNQRRG
ncbi:MAG: hypothetical protein HY204_00975 [Nitrospirae bacterium]|nr:hypothetical protein [Nitrospirota bacterium]